MSIMHVDFTTPGFVHPGPSADEQFFYDEAGYSYDPKTETPEEGRWRGAREHRKAELHSARVGWFVEWEVDPDPIEDDVEREEEYDQFIATLYSEDREILSGLCSVDLGPGQYPDCGDKSDPYVRVVEAELALEAMS